MKSSFFMRITAAVLSIVLCCGAFTGCQNTPTVANAHGAHLTDLSTDARGKASTAAPIPLSGFEDISGEDRLCAYQMRAELTDTYTFSCALAESIRVVTPAGEVTGGSSVQTAINAGDTVAIEVKTKAANTKFALEVSASEHYQRLPYLPAFTVDASTLSLYGDNTQKPAATEIRYTKRAGGTYVYLNNPEKLHPEDVGAAILRDEGLSGDVQVTWEHSNFTEKIVFLGYQLKNEGTTDVYVTVTNIGLQVDGEWLGQRSWSDYYNYAFDLPADYFDENGNVTQRYVGQDFIDYTPRVYQPTTYRIPAGQYIYVLGGTTIDAYNKTNVGGTADQMIYKGRCTNGVAKFFVTGGTVTGTFYCYTNPDQVKAEPAEQGYIVSRGGTDFGWQYKGVDYYTALIESNPVFIINDRVSGNLPVTYENYYDEAAAYRTKEAYGEFKSTAHTQRGHSWTTNINPQNSHRAVGTDMSSFECVTTDGKTVVIDTEHSDGWNNPGNFGNWMIDYHDNMTFVNQGDRARTVTINKSAQGALMALVMDKDGKVLSTKCTIVPLEESASSLQWELYSFEIPPHSVMQLSVSFLLMGNSYGGVGHWISVA